MEWSGQFENQISAKKRLELVIPIVVLIIFVLLYRTYRSARWKLRTFFWPYPSR